MSHERYTLEDRTKNHWRNPEWAKFADKKFRHPRIIQDTTDVLFHDDWVEPFPKAPESPTANGLSENGVVFPLETGQPCRATGIEIMQGGE